MPSPHSCDEALRHQCNREYDTSDFGGSEADTDAEFMSVRSDVDDVSSQSPTLECPRDGLPHHGKGTLSHVELSDISEESELESPCAHRHDLGFGRLGQHETECHDGSNNSSGRNPDWDPIDEQTLLIMTDPVFLTSTNAMHDRIATLSATRLTPRDNTWAALQTPTVAPFCRRPLRDVGVQTSPLQVNGAKRSTNAHREPSNAKTGGKGSRVAPATLGRLSIELELHVNFW